MSHSAGREKSTLPNDILTRNKYSREEPRGKLPSRTLLIRNGCHFIKIRNSQRIQLLGSYQVTPFFYIEPSIWPFWH